MRRIKYTCDICGRDIEGQCREIGRDAEGTPIISTNLSLVRLKICTVDMKSQYSETEKSIDLCEYHVDKLKLFLENERRNA